MIWTILKYLCMRIKLKLDIILEVIEIQKNMGRGNLEIKLDSIHLQNYIWK